MIVTDEIGNSVCKSPWILAEQQGSAEILAKLNRQYEDLSGYARDSIKTAIENAIEDNYVELATYLINNFSALVSEHEVMVKFTPLNMIEYAIHLQRKDIVKIMAANYGVNSLNRFQKPPVFYAIEMKHDQMLRFLAEECGADLNLEAVTYGERTANSFMLAAEVNNINAMSIIKSLGGNTNAIIDGKSALSANSIDLENIPTVKTLLNEYRLIPTTADLEYLIKLAVWSLIHDDTELATMLAKENCIYRETITRTLDSIHERPIDFEFPLSHREAKKVQNAVSDADAIAKTGAPTVLSIDQMPKVRLYYYVVNTRKQQIALALGAFLKSIDEPTLSPPTEATQADHTWAMRVTPPEKISPSANMHTK